MQRILFWPQRIQRTQRVNQKLKIKCKKTTTDSRVCTDFLGLICIRRHQVVAENRILEKVSSERLQIATRYYHQFGIHRSAVKLALYSLQ